MKKILVIENNEQDFLKARLPLIEMLNTSYEFYACYPGSVVNLETKIKTLEFPLQRNDKGFLQLLKLSVLISKYVSKYNIDLVHSFRFQPNIISIFSMYSTLRISHITGLGTVFSSRFSLNKFISLLIYQIIILRSDLVITQNDDDFSDINFLGSRSFLKNLVIYGSGVNTDVFKPKKVTTSKKTEFKILFVSRLLKSKGVIELIETVNLLNRSKFIENHNVYNYVKLDIVGWIDDCNPDSISLEDIKFYQNEFVVFKGKHENVLPFYSDSNLFCFPTKYREGVPRVLLEALSCGLPIITTNSPGCKECIDGNGVLISIVSVSTIFKAIIDILQMTDQALETLGLNSRKIALERFSQEVVGQKLLKTYNDILKC